MEKIGEKEKRKNTRDHVVSDEVRSEAWEAIEEREKVRTRSRSLLLNNLETERATGRELVKSHRALANSISNVLPQMGLFLGLKNLQTIDSCMEGDLSEVRSSIVTNIFAQAELLGQPLSFSDGLSDSDFALEDEQ